MAQSTINLIQQQMIKFWFAINFTKHKYGATHNNKQYGHLMLGNINGIVIKIDFLESRIWMNFISL